MSRLFSNFQKHLKLLLKPLGFIMLYLLVYFSVQFLVTMVMMIILLAIYMLTSSNAVGTIEGLLPILVGKVAIPSLLISAPLSLPLYYFILKARKQNPFKVCKIKSTGFLSLGIALILGVFTNFFVESAIDIIRSLISIDKLLESHDPLINSLLSGNIILIIIAVGIVAPFIEEIIFRGLVYSELRKISSVTVTIVIQALLFGIYHMNIVQGVYAAFFGVILGIIVYKTDSIWAPILTHCAFNCTSVIMGKLAPPGLGHLVSNNQKSVFVLSSLLIAAALVLMWNIPRKYRNNPQSGI